MGQLTAAIDARSGLITSSDTTLERWHQYAAMTIQQTIVREYGSNVPSLLIPPHIRETTPILGKKSQRSIGPLPTSSTGGASPFVVRSTDQSTFAAPDSSVILGHLNSSSALPVRIGAARRTVIASTNK
jgi:hypothetical protein